MKDASVLEAVELLAEKVADLVEGGSMAKRGQSGLSLVVGVDKPTGVTSHDVVSRCRRIFGEKRVGHTGTLDPLASGVLPHMHGRATRLDAYMTGHDKSYVVRIVFGAATDTDDCEGEIIRRLPCPMRSSTRFSPRSSSHRSSAPTSSFPRVLRHQGRRREGVRCGSSGGASSTFEPRDIEVHEAKLIAVNRADGREAPSWDVVFRVSSGTYIRALARDVGQGVGTCAHVGSLRRTSACRSGDAWRLRLPRRPLEELKERAALDPVKLLGHRFVFADDQIERLVANGNPLPERLVTLCERRRASPALEMCACTTGVRDRCEPACDGELVSVVARNKLAALYRFDAESRRYKSRCVFQIGVSRGSCI